MSNEENIARLEARSDSQEDKLHDHENRIKKLEEANKETLELRYDLKTLSSKLDNFCESQSNVNNSIQEAIKLLKDKTEELENAPKNAVYDIVKSIGRSLIVKLIPWLFGLGAIIYAYLQNK